MEESLTIPISALAQFLFCPRRCGLMFVEHTFVANASTIDGSLHHATVDTASHQTRGSFRLVHALPLFSHTLGLSGKADLVEFHDGVPFPVEYKRGRGYGFANNSVQLCAQALCLEEMFGRKVATGAIFHIKSKRRELVGFDDSLRRQTSDCIVAVRKLIAERRVPPGVLERKCDGCSLRQVCMPEVTDTSNRDRLRRYERTLWTV